MMTATKTAKKILLLQALIDHPRTGDEEREAGRRMLARLIARARTSGEKITATGWTDSRSYGAKYDMVRDIWNIAEIAKLMREDIKLVRKIGLKAAEPSALAVADPIADAPACIKFAVRTEKYSGGGSIHIIIRNIPEDWGYEMGTDEYGLERRVATPALKALAAELQAIHHAYNHNGSDITTDYFDVKYYGGVLAQQPGGYGMSV